MVLSQPSLLLNRNWTPIKVITAKKALNMLFEGRAKAVDSDYSVYNFEDWAELRVQEGEPCVHTARSAIRVPDVILLLKYGEIPEMKLAFSRANIYKRDKFTCQYCGKRPGTENLTIEHIVPRCRGGQSTWTNCVIACLPCNAKKADKTLHESGMVLRSKPVKPDWSPALVLAKVRNTPKNWEKFVSDAYWNTELKK
jgi:5-methylcytosine-specific restriction endonuclease McrA